MLVWLEIYFEIPLRVRLEAMIVCMYGVVDDNSTTMIDGNLSSSIKVFKTFASMAKKKADMKIK